MCFGGGDTKQTVQNILPPSTEEENQARGLALQSLQMRAGMLPYMIRPFGYELVFVDGKPTVKPLDVPSPEQQQMSQLQKTSLGGANDAANMMMERLRSGQGMIPGLLRAVQASQPQYRPRGSGPSIGPAGSGQDPMSWGTPGQPGSGMWDRNAQQLPLASGQPGAGQPGGLSLTLPSTPTGQMALGASPDLMKQIMQMLGVGQGGGPAGPGSQIPPGMLAQASPDLMRQLMALFMRSRGQTG